LCNAAIVSLEWAQIASPSCAAATDGGQGRRGARAEQKALHRGFGLLGHSEGADVAAGAARALGTRIAGVGLLSGAGATRFFDDTTLARRRGDLPGVKSALDDLIALTGSAPPAEYAGAASVREISYAIDSTPLEDTRAVNTPVFVAGGTSDDKAPIESADLFVAELLRDPTRAVRYAILPELDHALRDSKGGEHVGEVVHAFVDWMFAPSKPRLVTIGLTP
jgi:pimeloyl-ACP methyl ester carboxylesterase